MKMLAILSYRKCLEHLSAKTPDLPLGTYKVDQPKGKPFYMRRIAMPSTAESAVSRRILAPCQKELEFKVSKAVFRVLNLCVDLSRFQKPILVLHCNSLWGFSDDQLINMFPQAKRLSDSVEMQKNLVEKMQVTSIDQLPKEVQKIVGSKIKVIPHMDVLQCAKMRAKCKFVPHTTA